MTDKAIRLRWVSPDHPAYGEGWSRSARTEAHQPPPVSPSDPLVGDSKAEAGEPRPIPTESRDTSAAFGDVDHHADPNVLWHDGGASAEGGAQG